MAELSPDLSVPWRVSRPEAMADVPGVCEVPLTRAVVHYGDVHEADLPGGRIEDIGLALVVDGEFAASVQALDLGSAQLKQLDLSSELVVLDWVYRPTLEHVRGLLRAAADPTSAGRQGRRSLAPYCYDLALRILRRVGYGPLTRPVFLRLGFRDVCRDLDLHEGTSVRIVLERGRVARVRFDSEAAALIVATAQPEPDPLLEDALRGAFPGLDLRLVNAAPGTLGVLYQVRLPLPLSFSEARRTIRRVREGLGYLLARFEPERYGVVREMLETLGARDTLSRLRVRDVRGWVGAHSVPVGVETERVH